MAERMLASLWMLPLVVIAAAVVLLLAYGLARLMTRGDYSARSASPEPRS